MSTNYAAHALEKYFQLAPGEGEDMLPLIDTVALSAGEWLFHQGDPGDSLFLVFRGRVEAVLETPTERVLGEILPGESIGEVGMLAGEARSAGARAVRDSALIRIGRDQFAELSAQNPEVVLKLANHVARLLHRNTVNNGRSVRAPSQICLINLQCGEAATVTRQLTDQLRQWGEVLELSLATLANCGAPDVPVSADDPVSEDFSHWLSEQELQHDFVVLHCEANDGRWLEFACRQADSTLAIADCREAPQRLPVDHRMLRHLALGLFHDGEISGTGRWLDHVATDYHVHLRRDNQSDIARAARLLTGRGNGLVLGGGAARGFAHLGAYKALVDAGIPIDWIGGTSIGAILGAAIALDEGPDAAIERARHAFVEGRPFGDYTLPLISLLSGRRMTRLTRHHLPGNIEDLPIPFFAVSSNISNGNINIHERGEIWQATNASAALPGILPPVLFGTQLAMDGAVLNNLPVDIMQQKPIAQVFAVELASRESEFPDVSRVPSPWQALLRRMLPFGSQDDLVPGLGALVLKSIEVATRSRSKEMGDRADVLFNPPVQVFSLLNVENFDRIIAVGYEHARDHLAASKVLKD